MMPESGKRIVILYILQILRKYTDADHTMTQQQIVDKLMSEYGIEVNRATVRRNLIDLIDAGYDIMYDEVVRSHIDKKIGEKEERTSSIPICIMNTISRNQNFICLSTDCCSPGQCRTNRGRS